MKTILAMVVSGLMMGVANANMVFNGSFEQGTLGSYSGSALPKVDNAIPGWRIFDTTKAAVTFELVANEAEASDGTNYVKITSTTMSPGDAGLDVTPTGLGQFAVSVGTTYTVSFDAKRLGGTDNRMALTIKTVENSATLESLVNAGFALTSDWVTYTYQVTPTQLTSGGNDPSFYIAFRAKNAALLDETICIDKVSVIETPEPRSLVNGSFEEGPVGVLSVASDEVPGWRIFDTSHSNSVELVNDPLEATDGANYMKITSVLSGSGLGDTGVDTTMTGAGKCVLSTGNLYRISFDAKWVSGTDNRLFFYVKTQQIGASSALLEANLVNDFFALNTEWTTYSYEFTPTLQPTNPADDIVLYTAFRPKLGGALRDEVIYIDNVRLLDLSTGSYIGWTDTYPTLGTATNYTDDLDVDGMNNLLEYALGGDPTIPDASSVRPSSVMESGWMYYVYKQRKNYEAFGLDYQVLSGTELVLDPLTNVTSVIGSGEYDSDFNLVTNGIPTDAPSAFMQLTVEKDD